MNKMREYERGREDGLTEGVKNTIKSLPNFDAEIFRKCTGIKVESRK